MPFDREDCNDFGGGLPASRPDVLKRKRPTTPESTLFMSEPSMSQSSPALHINDICPSEEQQAVIELILSGHNDFITGSAGSGKSMVAKWAAKHLLDAGKVVYKVAPTGRAAVEIGGTTIHSFCSWSPADGKKPIKVLEKRAEAGRARKRFEDADVLIIDEISMVSNHTFEKLNRVLKSGKENDDDFCGGIQVIVCGDFCQLPPIEPFETCFVCGQKMMFLAKGKKPKHECTACGEEEMDKDKWAFRAQAWEEANFQAVYLTENHRQTEREFIRVLDKIRLSGKLTSEDHDLLTNHDSDTDGAIQLFPKRLQVEDINKQEFAKLPGKAIKYKCLDFFQSDPRNKTLDYRNVRLSDHTLKYLHDHTYDRWVELKQGMKVLLLQNIDIEGGLVNGSQGVVVGFEAYDEAKLPKSKVGIDYTNAESPGGSEEDESNSRKKKKPSYVKSRGGEFANIRHSQLLGFMKNEENKFKQWPIVRFDNGRRMVIFADCRLDVLGNRHPQPLEGRTQIPLLPLWAMTLHKAQGLSLDRVRVDLVSRFEAGQAFVALSRAKTLAGLKVESECQITEADVDKTIQAFHAETNWVLGSPAVLP